MARDVETPRRPGLRLRVATDGLRRLFVSATAPCGGAHITGRRLRALAAVGVALSLVATICAVVFIWRQETGSGLGLGAALAFLPLPVYLALVLWADRMEPEPPHLLAATFAWGAGAAFVLAYALNILGTRAVADVYGPRTADLFFLTLSAPVVEESLKAVPLVALLVFARHRLDDLVDGVVYAAVVGLGFAASENVLYYGQTALCCGLPAALDLFLLRGVWHPLIHPLFTAATGIGVAYAAGHRGRWRWGAPLLGLAVAILLHSLWNRATNSGWSEVVYIAAFAPLGVGVALATIAVRRREAHVLADYLPAAVGSEGPLPSALSTRKRRRALLARADSAAGRAGRDSAASYDHAAVELAFLQRRIARDQVVDDDGHQARRRELRGRFFVSRDELRRAGALHA